jgi:hypothetical protein
MRSLIALSIALLVAGCSSDIGPETGAISSSDTGIDGANASIDESSSSLTSLNYTPAAAGDTEPAPKWQCRWSNFAGKQFKTCGGGTCGAHGPQVGEKCTGGSLFYCDGTTPKKIKCANACTRSQNGTDDTCQ